MSTNIDPRIKKFKKIVSIDPYNKIYYKYQNRTLKPLKELYYDSKNFVISYIKNRDMIIASLDLGYGIDETEIALISYL